ncbi:glycosyltransferase [Bacillus sp. AK128]
MKIAQVYPYYGLNGLSRYIFTLNEELVIQNDQNQVFNFIIVDKDSPKEFMDTDQIHYNVVKRDLGISIDRKNLLEDCKIEQIEDKFIQFLEKYEPDIVNFQHLSDLGASLISIAKEKRIATVLTLHDYWTICPMNFLMDRHYNLCSGPNEGKKCLGCYTDEAEQKEIIEEVKDASIQRYMFIKNILEHKVDVIIAVSKSLKTKLLKEGIREEKIKVIYPALRTNPNFKKEERAREKLIFGFIGGLYIIKGPHVLIDAFARIKEENIELHIYGDSSSSFRRGLLEEIAKQDNRIIFKGKYQSDDLENIFNSIDVLVVPSVCPETGPLVVQEALRHKVPVIGSRIGGIPEYLHDEFGAMFEVGNSEALEVILKRIIKEPNLLTEWSNKIPDLPPTSVFGQEIQNIYKDLVRKHHSKQSKDLHKRILNKFDKAYMRRETIRETLPIQLNLILDFFKTMDYSNILVFGAGELGKTVAAKLLEHNIKVIYFVDNDGQKWGSSIDQIKIIGPKDIQTVNSDAILIVSDWELEIITQLKYMDIKIPYYGIYSFE